MPEKMRGLTLTQANARVRQARKLGLKPSIHCDGDRYRVALDGAPKKKVTKRKVTKKRAAPKKKVTKRKAKKRVAKRKVTKKRSKRR